MPYYTKLGQLPKKRHTQFRRPDGALYSEELFGTEGFVGPTSTMYHIHPPTQVSGWKTLYKTTVEYVERDVMRMRHLKTKAMPPHGDAVYPAFQASCHPGQQGAWPLALARRS